MRLELKNQGDGTAWLNFWDSGFGNNVVIRIFPDGTAQELSFPTDPMDETEIWTLIDLAQRLLEMPKE